MNETLLIVEDEENDAFLLKNALRKAGIQNPIQLADDGRMALDYLGGFGRFADRRVYPLPSIVFLDLKLPCVNGLAVLEWIRRETSLPPVVVVVLTSSTLDEDIERAYRLGANSYVVKPSSREKLIAIVNDFGNWWFKHDASSSQRFCLPVRSSLSRRG